MPVTDDPITIEVEGLISHKLDIQIGETDIRTNKTVTEIDRSDRATTASPSLGCPPHRSRSPLSLCAHLAPEEALCEPRAEGPVTGLVQSPSYTWAL